MKKRMCILLVAALVFAWAGALADRSTVPDYTDGSLSYRNVTVSGINWKYRQNVDEEPSKTIKSGNITADEIMDACSRGAGYALNYKIALSGVKSPCTYSSQIVFAAPDGAEFTYNTRLSFSQNVSYVWFDFIGAEFFLALYESKYTGVQSGTYQIYLYLDGMLADVSTFTVH